MPASSAASYRRKRPTEDVLFSLGLYNDAPAQPDRTDISLSPALVERQVDGLWLTFGGLTS